MAGIKWYKNKISTQTRLQMTIWFFHQSRVHFATIGLLCGFISYLWLLVTTNIAFNWIKLYKDKPVKAQAIFTGNFLCKDRPRPISFPSPIILISMKDAIFCLLVRVPTVTALNKRFPVMWLSLLVLVAYTWPLFHLADVINALVFCFPSGLQYWNYSLVSVFNPLHRSTIRTISRVERIDLPLCMCW